MIANRHFECTVRIQNDRGHRVVAAGPYRAIRHPGYLAMIVHALATPFMIGSMYALIPAGIAAAVMIARTALEDRTLREELDGYADYFLRLTSTSGGSRSRRTRRNHGFPLPM